MNPVTHLGIYYPSQRALACALGVTNQAVSSALSSGNISKLGKGRGLNNAQPFEYEGVTYISRAAASRILGIKLHKLRKDIPKKEKSMGFYHISYRSKEDKILHTFECIAKDQVEAHILFRSAHPKETLIKIKKADKCMATNPGPLAIQPTANSS